MFSKLLDVLNDLKPRQLLMLAGTAALLMFVVVYLAMTSLTEKKEMTVTAPPPTQTVNRSVVMAKDDISANTILQEDMLEVREVPATAVPKGAVMNMKDVVGQPVASAIYAGDIITVSKVFTDRSRVGFTGSIPENCRAVSVGISEITGVAGFARPGDYVDVILVEKGKTGASSRFLLQNVLLLAVNQNAAAAAKEESKEEGGKKAGNKPSIATLALTPEEMLELVSAASVGEIYLALRPFQAKDFYAGFGEYTLKSSLAENTVPVAPAAPQPAPQPAYQPQAAPQPAASAPSSGIRIIQGDKILGK